MKIKFTLTTVVLSVLGLCLASGFVKYGKTFLPDLRQSISESDRLIFQFSSGFAQINETLRQYAPAIEAYHVDHQAYPPSMPLCEASTDPERIKQIGGEGLSAIHPGQGHGGLHGLTTPVAYLPDLPLDGFTNEPRLRFYYRGHYNTESYDQGIAPLAYYNDDNEGWILISPGYDLDYDIVDPSKVYKASEVVPSEALSSLTFDPTNGTRSSGDVYRTMQ